MGHWGVRSYENDEAADALDAGFAGVHGDTYEDLMDDRNPLTADGVAGRLASAETLAAALGALAEAVGPDPETWDETARLAFAGVVVRHAELGVAIPAGERDRAVAYLRDEAIDWDESTARTLRKDREVRILGSAGMDRGA